MDHGQVLTSEGIEYDKSTDFLAMGGYAGSDHGNDNGERRGRGGTEWPNGRPLRIMQETFIRKTNEAY